MLTPEEATVCAQAIASQVVDLKATEVLVLKLPPDMDTGSAEFDRLRKELRRMLPEDAGTIRAIVLRSDMEMQDFDAEALARVGLSTRDAPPGPRPEELFPDCPLRAAAQAGWDSAMGKETTQQVHIANEGLRVILQGKRLDIVSRDPEYVIEHARPDQRPRGGGGPF